MRLFVRTNIKVRINPIPLLVFFLLVSSCVSISQYNAKIAELEMINSTNKGIKKEIKILEKQNVSLVDTIRKRAERAVVAEVKLKKKMDFIKAKVRIDREKLKELSVREPSTDEWTRNYIKTHPNKDTNSAKNIPWLSAKEKRIYYYLNWARLDPKGFCEKFIMPRLKNDTDNIYLITLVDYMHSMLPLYALKPNKTQWENAKCHAETSGKTGYTGHERQSKSCRSGFSGECCSYGLSDPLEIVLQLLIDENVRSLGHRYICFGLYTDAGIALAPHAGWSYNCVLDFS